MSEENGLFFPLGQIQYNQNIFSFFCREVHQENLHFLYSTPPLPTPKSQPQTPYPQPPPNSHCIQRTFAYCPCLHDKSNCNGRGILTCRMSITFCLWCRRNGKWFKLWVRRSDYTHVMPGKEALTHGGGTPDSVPCRQGLVSPTDTTRSQVLYTTPLHDYRSSEGNRQLLRGTFCSEKPHQAGPGK